MTTSRRSVKAAATRAAELLRKMDADLAREAARKVICSEPGCRSELIGTDPRRRANLTTWRCLDHRRPAATREVRP